MTEIFQRLDDIERKPPGRWIYAGTYPGDPDTTPDSPPFQNGVTGWLRFRRNGEWNLDVEAEIDIPGDAVFPLTVVTLDELYRPTHNVQAAGVGVDWELKTDGDLVVTGLSGGGGGCSCAAVDVTFDGSSTIPADNVQDAIEEVKQELLDHIADPVSAHAASAISVATELLDSNNVEDALEELSVCCFGSGAAGDGSGAAGDVPVGVSELVYKYTVSGIDKASIDTGVDTPDAGSNDWTNCDELEFRLYARTDESTSLSEVKLQFNNDTAAHYDWQWTRVLNTTAANFIGLAANYVDAQVPGASVSDAAVFGQVALTMTNPTGTVGYKTLDGGGTVKVPGDAANTGSYKISGQFRSTSAVTRAAVTPVTAGKKFKVGTQLLVYKRRST